MRAIDLYSGIGGWTVGLRMAGVDVVKCYDWWRPAIDTYNKNLPPIAFPQDIRELEPSDIDVTNIDIVVGSPPCTQFSYSNRGGGGDVKDGLKDISKFLEIVEHLKPKLWAMENVPRVKKVLEVELAAGGQLERYRDLVKVIEVVDASEFGTPQRRRRMIAGDFPFDLLTSYRDSTPTITLGNVLDRLHSKRPKDPIYDIALPQRLLTDMANEDSLDREEKRINREAKFFHPVYNKMPFPEPKNRPARTVTALCTRVSRESIVITDPENSRVYRRLNVRERACLQGFPITYQIQGRSHAEKIKLVGNAIPPPLTYHIAHAMKGTKARYLPSLSKKSPDIRSSNSDAIITTPTTRARTFPTNRTFRAALPNLRFGSGVRFELVNRIDITHVGWEVRFFFGSSKDIQIVALDSNLWTRLQRADFFVELVGPIDSGIDSVVELIGSATAAEIQENWTRRSKGLGPFRVVDALGKWSKNVGSALRAVPKEPLERFVRSACGFDATAPRKNGLSKLLDHAPQITAGFVCGAWFNVRGPLKHHTRQKDKSV